MRPCLKKQKTKQNKTKTNKKPKQNKKQKINKQSPLQKKQNGDESKSQHFYLVTMSPLVIDSYAHTIAHDFPVQRMGLLIVLVISTYRTYWVSNW